MMTKGRKRMAHGWAGGCIGQGPVGSGKGGGRGSGVGVQACIHAVPHVGLDGARGWEVHQQRNSVAARWACMHACSNFMELQWLYDYWSAVAPVAVHVSACVDAWAGRTSSIMHAWQQLCKQHHFTRAAFGFGYGRLPPCSSRPEPCHVHGTCTTMPLLQMPVGAKEKTRMRLRGWRQWRHRRRCQRESMMMTQGRERRMHKARSGVALHACRTTCILASTRRHPDSRRV